MRLSSLALLLGAAACGAAAGDPAQENTYFDGKKVPPILQLGPDTFDKEVKASKWLMVKHYR